MFSPSINSAPTGSVRSSRRRQRPLSNDGSIPQPKAKRQRSTLSQDTFTPLDGAPEMVEAKSHIATLPRRESSMPERREIVVRGKKPKSGDRGAKGDGSVILVCYHDTWILGTARQFANRPLLHPDHERYIYC
jgi:nuclear pore complex protein Nup133